MSLRTRSLSLFLAVACAGLARAQDPPPTPPPPTPPPLTDDELRALRDAAEAELAGPAPEGETPEEALRRSAQGQTDDTEQVLYGNLLDSFYAVANRLNAFNPRITAFGDVVGRWSVGSHELVEDGRNVDDRVALAEAEIDLRADVDPYSKAVLIIAFEEEGGGEYAAGIEEGYVTLETLPWGFHATIGRFRVPFGRMNALHRHDLPQTTRPYASTDLFGEEGLVEQGAILQWLAPYVPLELRVAVMNGENDRAFGGTDSDDPSYLGRAEYFLQLTPNAFASVGASYLYGHGDRPDPLTDLPSRSHLQTHVFGADLLLKWQWNQFQSVAVQGELYSLRKELDRGGPYDHAFGAYGFIQLQPAQRWYLGLRYDYSDFDEGVEDADQWATSGWVSYYTTEFLRFRLGYEHRERSSTNGGEPDNDTIFFQLTFVFGSHPAEPFWVNR